MLDPTYPLFPIFAFTAFVLGIVPLSWHLEAWNAGTCAYMLWASIASLVEFVNAIVWRDTALNLAPVWCDITSKFLLGAGVGVPASSLCICRRLYKIATIQTVSLTRQDKRRMLIEDLCIAVGIPTFVMTLHVVVQGHRFDVLENIGCYADVYVTLPAYFLVYMWPVVLGCISFTYAGLTLRAFWKRRVQFNELISTSNALSFSRFLRLMLLACTEMACTIPLGIYSIYISTTGVEISPWVSWKETHFDFGHVRMIPAVIWRSDHLTRTSVEMTRWLLPVSALLFFALFGFANEAYKHYRLVFWWIAGRFGFKPRTQKPRILPFKRNKPSPNSSPSGTLPPAYRPPTPLERKCRIDSFNPSFAGIELYSDIEKAAGLRSSSSSLSEAANDNRSSLVSSNYMSAESFDATQHSSPQPSEKAFTEAVLASYYPYQPPAPRPPSPVLLHEGSAVSKYHRPFSPPSIYPVVSYHRSAQHGVEGGIHVTIHKQSTTSF